MHSAAALPAASTVIAHWPKIGVEALCYRQTPVDAPLFFDRREQALLRPDRFSIAKKEHAFFFQGKMEQRDHALLHSWVEVDQQIPAANQVELGKGRIAGKVLRRKHHRVAQRLAGFVVWLLMHKIALQALGRYVVGNAFGVQTQACRFQRLLVDIGGENLQRGRLLNAPQQFAQADRQRIGFFAGSAAGHPHAQGYVFRVGAYQRLQHALFKRRKSLGVAKKVGNADQQVFEERLHFVVAVFQHAQVFARADKLVQAHAALDAPHQGVALVRAEVVIRFCAYEIKNRNQRIGQDQVAGMLRQVAGVKVEMPHIGK